MSKEKRTVLTFDSDREPKVDEEVVKRDKKKAAPLPLLGLVSDVGFTIALPIVGGVMLGKILDDRFHTSPMLTLSFLFLGIFLGFAAVYQQIRKLQS